MAERATLNDIVELRGLWKLVFGDGDRFLDSFFRNLFRPDQCLVIRSEGRIASMLFMLDATWSGRTADHPMRYIYACATHPDFRKQGMMGRLLEEAAGYADANGIELSLVPEDEHLAAYYGHFGFTEGTYLYRRKYPPLSASKGSSQWLSVPDSENTAILLGNLRTHFWKGRDAVLWPEAHLRVALDEVYSQGGEFLTMKTGGGLPSGYALTLPRGAKVDIMECACALPQDDMVTSLRNHYKSKTTLFTLAEGVAASCAEIPYALVRTHRKEKVPYLNLALDF